MRKLHEVSLWLVVLVFALPAAVVATEAPPIGNQPTVIQEPAPTTTQGGTSASREKAGKKSNQDVESRGLFKKKKKKKKGGAAGHSQPSESGDLGVGSGASR
jgi:hypothetical protein